MHSRTQVSREKGSQLWWRKRDNASGMVPVRFVGWKRQDTVIMVEAPHTGRIHEVRTTCLFPALDAAIWEARFAELQATAAEKKERERLLDSCVPVGALVRELQRQKGRRKTVEAVLAAAARIGGLPEPLAAVV